MLAEVVHGCDDVRVCRQGWVQVSQDRRHRFVQGPDREGLNRVAGSVLHRYAGAAEMVDPCGQHPQRTDREAALCAFQCNGRKDSDRQFLGAVSCDLGQQMPDPRVLETLNQRLSIGSDLFGGQHEMRRSFSPPLLQPISALRIGDRLCDGGVAAGAAGVGEQHVPAVEQPQVCVPRTG